MKKVWLSWILLLFLLPILASAATYYVSTAGSDTNPGTQAQPWRTIQKAANTMAAGDTVIIRNGTYNEIIDLTGSTGVEGKSGNSIQGYISYIGESRDGVIIDGTGLGWGSGFVSGAAARGDRAMNFIKISRMTLQNFAGDGVIFYANKSDGNYPRSASHDIIVENLKVHDNQMGGIMFCGGEEPNTGYNFVVRNCEVYNNYGAHHGIKISGDPREIYDGDHIHDSIVENNIVYNNGGNSTTEGIGIHVSSGNYRITVRNNTAYGNRRNGIAAHMVWDSVYEGNTAYNNGQGHYSYDENGIIIWRSRNVTVRNNRVYGNSGNTSFGIVLGGTLGSNYSSNLVVVNNLIYNNGGNTYSGGIEIRAETTNSSIYNNLIANNGLGIRTDNAGSGNRIINNILYKNTRQLLLGTGNSYDYNIYYPSINFSGKGSHDLGVDPLFVNQNATDYHLLS